MPETLGDRIRKARVKYGMSQVELARRIGISGNAMNLIECGKTPDPAASRIKAIADVLRVSADYLLGRKEDESELLTAAVA
jgi:transcriptional regulator with XRE-family HTH domain